MRPPLLLKVAAAVALVGCGAIAARLLEDRPPAARADAVPAGSGSFMQVVNSQKTNEPLVFLYDEASRRLMVYTLVNGGNGPDLKVAAIRNTEFDAKVQEYRNTNEKGMSVRELQKAFEAPPPPR
jgi:hypothetical protein